MIDLMCIDKNIYDSCPEYVYRIVRQQLVKAMTPACDGEIYIKELCEKCPFYRLADSANM